MFPRDIPKMNCWTQKFLLFDLDNDNTVLPISLKSSRNIFLFCNLISQDMQNFYEITKTQTFLEI